MLVYKIKFIIFAYYKVNHVKTIDIHMNAGIQNQELGKR
jgi:hypothetical protein